jgi:glycine cleavage system H lipoate-binding protein
MAFPNPLLIQRVNSHLRGNPARWTADPYGSGWLFAAVWQNPVSVKEFPAFADSW